jgi:hypothetical protein
MAIRNFGGTLLLRRYGSVESPIRVLFPAFFSIHPKSPVRDLILITACRDMQNRKYPVIMDCFKTDSAFFYFSGGEFQVLRIKTAGFGFCTEKHARDYLLPYDTGMSGF